MTARPSVWTWGLLCLFKLWEMFHEHNYGRVLDKQKFVEQLAKLKAEYVKLCTEYIKLVEDTQANIIQNTRKAMKEVEVDRDLLQNENTKLEQVISKLLKDGYGIKEKLEQIKAILES
ncbi:hypothetical protein D1007_14065 [Hordeum vulgare]|nr:hypothetical protein D1007_14065 [Hordeum vulgare]